MKQFHVFTDILARVFFMTRATLSHLGFQGISSELPFTLLEKLHYLNQHIGCSISLLGAP